MRRWMSLGVGVCLVSVVLAEEERGLTLSGFVETSLTANVADPPAPRDNEGNPLPTNRFYPYFTQPRSFHIGTVHVAASGSKGKASYTLEFDAGTVAKINSGGLVDVQEAYITYDFGEVKLTAGKFVTFEGIEVIETPLNPVITHGFLYYLAEPVYHVGAYATIPLGEKFEARVGLVNGWDALHDDTADKTLLGRLSGNYGYLTWGLSGTYGKEGGPEPRLSLDLTGALNASDKLALNYQGNYGQENVENETAKWFGVGLQPVLALTEKLTLSARGELFKDDGPDDDGFRTETDQTLFTLTGCLGYRLAESTRVRGEVRWDRSDKSVFLDRNGQPTEKSQTVVSLQLTQMF